MKKVAMLNICALILIFLTAGIQARPNTDSAAVELLLEQRITILNHYYGGKMNFDDARTNVEKIAADSLLKEDLRLMKAFDGEEVDQVASFDVDVAHCSRTSFGIIKGQADVYWLMQGAGGQWETEESYYFTAEDDQGKIKLTQLKKL